MRLAAPLPLAHTVFKFGGFDSGDSSLKARRPVACAPHSGAACARGHGQLVCTAATLRGDAAVPAAPAAPAPGLGRLGGHRHICADS